MAVGTSVTNVVSSTSRAEMTHTPHPVTLRPDTHRTGQSMKVRTLSEETDVSAGTVAEYAQVTESRQVV